MAGTYIPPNPNGQALMAGSEPVVIASNQSPIAVTVGSLPIPSGAATEVTLLQIHTDLATTLAGLIDGLEGSTDGIETKLDTLHADLVTTLAAYVDGLEGLIGTSNTALVTLHTDIATTLAGFVDGLETLITASNTKLDTVHADLVTTLGGYVDGLEALVTATSGYVDGLETLIASSNTKLDTVHADLTSIDGHVDGLETLVTSTNTKLDTVAADLVFIDNDLGLIQIALTDIFTIESSNGTTLAAIDNELVGANILLSNVGASATSIDGKLVLARTADFDSGVGSVTTEMIGIALPASGGPVIGGTSTNPIRVDPTGSTVQPVSVGVLPLPSGASTEATLLTIDGRVDGLETNTASTNTKLDTVNTNLSAIDGHVDGLETAVASTNTKLDTGNASLASIDAGIPAGLGTAAIAASMPVNIASDQTVPVSAATLPLPSGAATEATLLVVDGHIDGLETSTASTNTKLDTVNTNLTTIDGRVDGLETAVASTNTKLDTVNTNLGTIDGRVDGIEASLISIDGGTPAALGQTTMSSSSPVTLASDQTTVPVSNRASVVNAAVLMQNAAVANGNGSSLTVAGYAVAVMGIVSSPAMSGGTTVNFEESTDNGTTWRAIAAHQIGVNGSLISTTTSDGDYRFAVAGLSLLRARISGYSAGAVTVNGYVSVQPSQPTTIALSSTRTSRGVQQTTITSTTAETTIVTAVASTFLDLYGIIITNTSATVCKVTIKDATAGTTRAVFEIPATDTRGFMVSESAAVPQAAVNNNWTAICGTAVAAIEITALYIKNL